LAENTLAIFERLDTFPTDSEELNAWWVEPLGVKPPKPKTSKGVDADEDADEIPSTTDADADDDWRKYFDEPSSDIKDSKKPHARLHTLTVHQSLHSLPSHRAVFTRAWLTLLPRLQRADAETENRPLSVRALTVLHRGVFPHLTRPVLVMDWVSECVDYGGAAGLLALNALFALIKEYNLYVHCASLPFPRTSTELTRVGITLCSILVCTRSSHAMSCIYATAHVSSDSQSPFSRRRRFVFLYGCVHIF
jgi:U3 small nucleolar RNA-associated protein 19